MKPTQLALRLQKKIDRVLLVKRKRLAKSLAANTYQEKKVLFVVGCQRSGTTMMLRIFERDVQTRVFGEFSKLSSQDPDNIRLNPLPLVKQEIDNDPAPFVVLKPLVETQNLLELLKFFPTAKALWMYRDYRDVASSNLKRFDDDNGVSDLRPVVEQAPDDWRSEWVNPQAREMILQHFSEDMPPHDAAALFWYVRNHIYFDLDLAHHPRVMLCRYADLVSNPRRKLSEIYGFVNQLFPNNIITDDISASSVGKGKNIKLAPEIEALCQNMLERLDEVNRNKEKATA